MPGHARCGANENPGYVTTTGVSVTPNFLHCPLTPPSRRHGFPVIQTRFMINIFIFTIIGEQFTIFSYNVHTFIAGKARRQISLANLSTIPRFICFDCVSLTYESGGPMKSEKKCRKVAKYLKPIKTASKHSNLIRFDADINQDDQSSFTDHSILLAYLSEQFLQICDTSRRYEFIIYFHSDKNAGAGTNLISSLLQMPAISRCSNFEISLYHIEEAQQLPVENISDWLNRRKTDGQIPQEIFMTIRMNEIQNATEMCDHLSKVRFIFIAV